MTSIAARSLPVVCAVLLFGAPRPGLAELLDRVLATVDGHVIMQSDVRAVETLRLDGPVRAIKHEPSVLDQLIDRTLVLAEVERYAPPEPDPAAIAERVAVVRRRFASDGEYEATLDRLGMDHSFVRQWMRNDLRILQYLDQRFAGATEPTEDELDTFRRQHAAELGDTRALSPADADRLVRDRARAARRAALIDEWLRGLRTRAEITVNPPVRG